MYAKIIALLTNFLPDTVKTLLIKIACFVAMMTIAFGGGFYCGWHMKNEEVLNDRIEAIEQAESNFHGQLSESINQSEQTYEKLVNQGQFADEIREQQKEAKHQDSSGVLNLALPDSTVWMLNNATSSRPKENSSPSGNNNQNGKPQALHGENR